jgi:hypothetical protein
MKGNGQQVVPLILLNGKINPFKNNIHRLKSLNNAMKAITETNSN